MVSAVTIRDHTTRTRLPRQCTGDVAPTRSPHHTYRHPTRHGHPEPPSLVPLPPARLIEVGTRWRLYVGAGCLAWRYSRGRGGLRPLAAGAHPPWDVKHCIHHLLRHPFGQAIRSRTPRHQRLDPRTVSAVIATMKFSLAERVLGWPAFTRRWPWRYWCTISSYCLVASVRSPMGRRQRRRLKSEQPQTGRSVEAVEHALPASIPGIALPAVDPRLDAAARALRAASAAGGGVTHPGIDDICRQGHRQ